MVNVLAFFAHPDDETMLAGGTLALLAQAGAAVHYLCATRGEGGETGEPPLCERADLGRLRQQEMDCAVKVLGGSGLSFLEYQDPLVGPDDTLFAYTDDLPQLVELVREAIGSVDAQAVITHGSNGEYGHPAHILTHQVTILALRELAQGVRDPVPALYTVQALFPDHPKPRLANKDDLADLVLDVSSVLDLKTRAALCHRSQHALFVRRASEAAGRPMTVPEVITAKESLHRVKFNTDENGKDDLFDMLKDYKQS